MYHSGAQSFSERSAPFRTERLLKRWYRDVFVIIANEVGRALVASVDEELGRAYQRRDVDRQR
jgi:hypothetical protein